MPDDIEYKLDLPALRVDQSAGNPVGSIQQQLQEQSKLAQLEFAFQLSQPIDDGNNMDLLIISSPRLGTLRLQFFFSQSAPIVLEQTGNLRFNARELTLNVVFSSVTELLDANGVHDIQLVLSDRSRQSRTYII